MKKLVDTLLPRRKIYLCLLVLGTVLLGSSAAQVSQPDREFSAKVLMRMAKEKSGVGARVYVKQGDVYLDFPDLVNKRHIPFWFLSNGVVASVKAATDENFNPGPTNPLVAGIFLRFHPTNADRFCQEFRSYSLAIMKAQPDGLSDEALRNLQKPESFPCEQTGHESVAGRDCATFRVAGFILGQEEWMTISLDPKLATILQVRVSPPQGLIVLLDAIEEGPQSADLFVLPPDHVTLLDPNKPAGVAPE